MKIVWDWSLTEEEEETVDIVRNVLQFLRPSTIKFMEGDDVENSEEWKILVAE